MGDASEIEATGFYAKMSKPDAPLDGGILGAARSAQERPSSSPSQTAKPTASRDVEAPGEPAERTIAEIDEERRQEEAGRAERMFDLPMSGDDGPRFDEPVMDTFTAEIPDDLAVNLKDGEGEQIGQALVAAGLGNTTAASFMRMGVEASRNGPLSDHQVQQKNADGMKVLQERWGDQTGAKLQVAKTMIQEASAKWPGLKEYLNATGLGSDPKLIQQLVARAERRPGRK
jgi:hypothetical protein